MALDNFLRGIFGCATPTDDEGVANKAYVDSAISTAISAIDLSGLSGGIVGATETGVTHSTNGDLALDLDDGADYVFLVDMSANITGLSLSNTPSGATMVVVTIVNSAESAKTVDLTGESDIIPYGELIDVVSIAAGEAFWGLFLVRNV